MNSFDFPLIKSTFYNACLNALSAKLIDLKKEVEQLRFSIANDSKSSMGDKYETSREMMQQEINRLEQQASLTAQQVFNLKTVNLQKKYNVVEKGSLVETNIGLFFIAVSYGEIKVDQQACVMISEFAPLSKLLLKKTVNDKIELNKKQIEISGIY